MSANYFELFELPVSFRPDKKLLRRTYLKLSREFHPDFHAEDSEAYDEALQKTSEINEAYKTLTDHFECIRYVLSLNGESITSEDKLPPDFLMDMMDWNERFMEAQMGAEPAEIEKLTSDFAALENSFENRLNQRIEAFESKGDSASLNQIKESYLQQKYLLRLKEQLNKFAAL